jgi:hypothetical protein
VAKLGLSLDFMVRKFVLVIGDEGAVLVHVVRANVKNAWFVPIDSEEGPESIREFLAQDRKAPLFVEVDVVEQLYREEALPKTNPLDHPKVLKRRLELAFVSEEFRAAKALAKKLPTGHKPYLFMALPVTDWLKKWRVFLETVSNPVTAFALLPMESLDMVEALAPPAESISEKHWRIFVSQEVTGGFRQIIQLNGQFILTRMTPKPAEDDTPEDVSQLIEREFKSSIGYIKRLGFNESDHLDLVAVVSHPIREALYNRDLPVTSLSVFTPFEAGERLGFEKVADPESPYSDVLHAVWLARKKKAPLLLENAAMKKRRQIREVEKVIPLAAALVTAVQIYYAGDLIANKLDVEGRGEEITLAIESKKAQIIQLTGSLAESDVPYDKAKEAVDAVFQLGKYQLQPADVLEALGRALDGKSTVTRLELLVNLPGLQSGRAGAPPPRSPDVKPQTAQPAASGAQKAAGPGYTINLDLAIPGLETAPMSVVVSELQALEGHLRREFPGAQVTLTNSPARYKSNESFVSSEKPGKPEIGLGIEVSFSIVVAGTP